MTVPPWKNGSQLITVTKLQWSGQSRRCQRLDNLDTIVILLVTETMMGTMTGSWTFHRCFITCLCVNRATADPRPLNLTSEMTSKVTTKIWWRAATGPLPEHWDDVMKEKKPAKIRMTKNKQTLVEKSAALLHDWVDWVNLLANLCSLGTESQTLEANQLLTHQGQMGSTMMLSVFLFVFERPEMSRKTFFPPSSPTQNPMRKRKATLGIESGPCPTGGLACCIDVSWWPWAREKSGLKKFPPSCHVDEANDEGGEQDLKNR